jgi:hypothetical protein
MLTPLACAKKLAELKIISEADCVRFAELQTIRNYIVHSSTFDKHQVDLGRYMVEMHELRAVLSGLIEKNSK